MNNYAPPPPSNFPSNWEDSFYHAPPEYGEQQGDYVDVGQHCWEPVNGHHQNGQTPDVSPVRQPTRLKLPDIVELAQGAVVLMPEKDKGIDSEDSSEEPPGPDYIHLRRHTPHWWLDEYIAHSQKHSPRAFDALHEACGLWLLSGMVAGRVIVYFGGKLRYPALMITVIARSSVWAKSHTIGVAERVLSEAGLDWRELPSKATPQAIIQNMSDNKKVVEIRREIRGLSEDDGEAISKLQYQLKMLEDELGLRWAHEGQRVWHISEFGSKIIAGMMRQGSPLSDFSDLLRDINDKAGKAYTYETRGHGQEKISNPYLAIIADTTPSDLRPYAKPNAPLWGNGFFPRFSIIVPGKDEKPNYARVPYEMQWENQIPVSLTQPLIDTDQWLGRRDGYDSPFPCIQITYSQEIWNEFYGYEQHIQSTRLATEDLDGSYSRLANEQCLSIAVLLAVVDGRTEILISDVHRAIECCERIRKCTDDFYLGMTENEVDERELKTARDEERALRIIGKIHKKTGYWPTASEIKKRTGPHGKRWPADYTLKILLSLQMEGAVEEFKYEDKAKRGKRYRLTV